MDVVIYLGLGLVALSICVRWWRIFLPLSCATLLAWAVDIYTHLQTVWFTYLCIAVGLRTGLQWYRAVTRRSTNATGEP